MLTASQLKNFTVLTQCVIPTSTETGFVNLRFSFEYLGTYQKYWKDLCFPFKDTLDLNQTISFSTYIILTFINQIEVSTSLMGEIRVLNENRNISVSEINQLDLLSKYHDYTTIFAKVDSMILW